MTEKVQQLCNTLEDCINYIVNDPDFDKEGNFEDIEILRNKIKIALDRAVKKGEKIADDIIRSYTMILFKTSIEKDIRVVFDSAVRYSNLEEEDIKKLIDYAKEFKRDEMVAILESAIGCGQIEKMRRVIETMIDHSNDEELLTFKDSFTSSMENSNLNSLRENLLTLCKMMIKKDIDALYIIGDTFTNSEIKELIKYASEFNRKDIIVKLCGMLKV